MDLRHLAWAFWVQEREYLRSPVLLDSNMTKPSQERKFLRVFMISRNSWTSAWLTPNRDVSADALSIFSKQCNTAANASTTESLGSVTDLFRFPCIGIRLTIIITVSRRLPWPSESAWSRTWPIAPESYHNHTHKATICANVVDINHNLAVLYNRVYIEELRGS